MISMSNPAALAVIRSSLTFRILRRLAMITTTENPGVADLRLLKCALLQYLDQDLVFIGGTELVLKSRFTCSVHDTLSTVSVSKVGN